MRKVWRAILIIITVLTLLPFGPLLAQADNSRNGKALVLIYHHLAPSRLKIAYNRIILSPLNFEAQMKYLRNNKYNVISLREMAESMEKKIPFPPKTVVITFDDGYESNYVYAYPVLKKYNIKATINVVVGTIKETNPPFRPDVTSMLTWPQVQEMQASGLVDFQSHTYNQHHYALLDGKGERAGPVLTNQIFDWSKGRQETNAEYKERVYQDLSLAKSVLEEKLGQPIFALTYPFGSYNSETQELAEKAGYKMLVTVKNGHNKPGEQLTDIKRVNVGRGDSFPSLLGKWLGAKKTG